MSANLSDKHEIYQPQFQVAWSSLHRTEALSLSTGIDWDVSD